MTATSATTYAVDNGWLIINAESSLTAQKVGQIESVFVGAKDEIGFFSISMSDAKGEWPTLWFNAEKDIEPAIQLLQDLEAAGAFPKAIANRITASLDALFKH